MHSIRGPTDQIYSLRDTVRAVITPIGQVLASLKVGPFQADGGC